MVERTVLILPASAVAKNYCLSISPPHAATLPGLWWEAETRKKSKFLLMNGLNYAFSSILQLFAPCYNTLSALFALAILDLYLPRAAGLITPSDASRLGRCQSLHPRGYKSNIALAVGH